MYVGTSDRATNFPPALLVSRRNSLFAALGSRSLSKLAQNIKIYTRGTTKLSSLVPRQLQISKRIPSSKTDLSTIRMCFGERTTYVCPMSMCDNKSWETRWYTFGAEPGKCALGKPVGSCIDPYMSYHQQDKYCVACLTGSNERSPPPPSPPERYHPEDHGHEHPPILHYDCLLYTSPSPRDS